jgi:hypothetical protein
VSAAGAEYIRKHFRDISGGLARINTVDKNFFIRDVALSRQSKKLKDKIIQNSMKNQGLVDLNYITSSEGMKKLAKNDELAKKYLSIEYKRKALKEYYEFVLKVGQESPEVDVFGMVTGTHGLEPAIKKEDKPSVYYSDLIRSPGFTGDVDLSDLGDEAYGFETPSTVIEESQPEEESEPDILDDDEVGDVDIEGEEEYATGG